MKSWIVSSMKYFLSCLLVLSAVTVAREHQEPEKVKHGAVVIQLRGNGKIAYVVNGRPLSLLEFSQYAEKQLFTSLDENDPYYVMYRDDVPFYAVIDARMALQRLPFHNVRYFYFGREERYMVEIQMKQAYPYSQDPDEHSVDPATHP